MGGISSLNSLAFGSALPSAPPAELGSLPKFTPLMYTRHLLRSLLPPQLQQGIGCNATLQHALSLQHPCSQPPPLHPLYARVLMCTSQLKDRLGVVRYARFAFWCNLASQTEVDIPDWLANLPPHCRSLYEGSGLHGPFLGRIHAYLKSLGYTDVDAFDDASTGLPSGGVLPVTGLNLYTRCKLCCTRSRYT